jgi:predicted transcriptional regulator
MSSDKDETDVSRSFIDGALEGLGPRARQVVEYFLAHPSETQTEIAKHFGISAPRVSRILRSNRTLQAMTASIKHQKQLDSALAYKSYRETMQSSNDEVKRKSATRLLEENKIFGPAEVNVNMFATLSIEELKRKAGHVGVVPETVVDSDLIDDSEG